MTWQARVLGALGVLVLATAQPVSAQERGVGIAVHGGGFNGLANTYRPVRPCSRPDFRDADQRVRALADVRVLRDEVAADHHPSQLDDQPAARRHPCAPVRRDVDKDSLDPLGVDIDVEGKDLLGENEFDVVACHALQDRRQVPQQYVDVDPCEGTGLLLAVH